MSAPDNTDNSSTGASGDAGAVGDADESVDPTTEEDAPTDATHKVAPLTGQRTAAEWSRDVFKH